MARWQTVAEGTSLYNLSETIADMELTKGTKIKVVMDLKWPVAWAFDVAGAELIFKPFIPDGVDLIDVYGEGNKGIVDMEADPIWLGAFVLFIKTHWLAIAIALFTLGILISFITIAIKVPAIAQIPIWLVVGAIGGAVGILYLASRTPSRGGIP